MSCYIITTEFSHTGLVPESPTFFNSSPFKVLSPQPPKFLKSLLPVKEENKAKKVLEARPLLGQEVRRKELYSLLLKRGEFMSLLFPFSVNFSSIQHCQSPVKPFYHVTYHIKLHFHNMVNILPLIKDTNCPKLPEAFCENGFAVVYDWTKN